MNKYSPFKAAARAAVVELTSTQAQQFYKTRATEDLHLFLCFVLTLAAIASLFIDRFVQARLEPNTRAVLALTGKVPVALLPPSAEYAAETPKPSTSEVSADQTVRLQSRHQLTTRIDRLISTVNEFEASRPRPKTRRVGFTSTNIVFGIDGKTVKELRAIAKEQGYRNTSKLTKAELLGLLA
jgi:hypothetical protein